MKTKLYLLFALSGFFLWIFYTRYWKYRSEIDTLTNSSYIVPDGVNLTVGGIVWSVPGLIFLMAIRKGKE